jgi:molybdenum cofactor guanylyltransferase
LWCYSVIGQGHNCLPITYKVGYVDASHKEVEGEMPFFHAEWTDKIKFQRYEQKGNFEVGSRSVFFNEVDLVLVNGNHFEAQQQLVVLDPKKMESLAKKTKKLTNVRAFKKPSF